MQKSSRKWALIAATVILLPSIGLADDDATYSVELDSQPLSESLKSFADQTGLQVVFFSEVTEGVEAVALNGDYTANAALDELLDDSGLTYEYINDKAVTVKPVSKVEGSRDSGNSQPTPVLMAQNQTSATQTQTSTQNSANEEANDAEVEIEEIIVTGSNIRGLKNSSSPVFVFDREDIVAAGYATLNQFMQTVPQNFGGGANENGAVGTAPVESNVVGGGTGINLRGLGNTSTLTLVNGRRVSPAGVGNYVDISSIPTAAIDRIEVLTDGASAIYGSDAVGGVVNVILRNDYDRTETSVRYGAVSDGGLDELTVSQTFGLNWESGNALLAYEYFDRSELNANEREFSKNAPGPQHLLPKVERHSLFTAFRQDIAENVILSGQAFFNTRDVNSASARFIALKNDDEVEEYGGFIGAEIDLGTDWLLLLSGNYSQSESNGVSTQVDDGVVRTDSSLGYDVLAVDVVADGPAFRLPGGAARLALGAQYREEGLSDSVTTGLIASEVPGSDRDVVAFFSELSLPLVGESNRLALAESIELTLAVRHEDYSDFGGTTDPKIGLSWELREGFAFRGSYGTSFRAPLLFELNGNPPTAFVFPLTDPVLMPGGGTVPVLIVSSNSNRDLGPETATTWTVGVDLEFQTIPGLAIGLTYFDIEFEDRIENPFGSNLSSALNPEFVSIVPRDPSAELVQSFVDQSQFFDFGTPLSSVRAIVDSRVRNSAAVEVGGFDLSISYSNTTKLGNINLGFNGTYLTTWDERVFETIPSMDQLNKVFRPSDTRFRGSAGWSSGPTSATLFLNHVAGSTNDLVTPNAEIDSWTTVDLHVQYEFGEAFTSDFADGLTVSLNVNNLFDEDPPFVENPDTNVNFDGANANSLGPFVSVQVTKEW